MVSSRYRLLDVLGSGGMSTVWRARDLVLDREVAVKILNDHGDGLRREAIRSEALAAAKLSHPHIANVFDYGESEMEPGRPAPFVVMELLRGRSLATVAEPLPAPSALRICAEVASALATAHAHGVVHRDVKPGNIMLTPGGARVFDFGLAASVGSVEGADSHQLVLGTPAYAAPERLAGAPVTPAADVYALGVLLFRLLTHELPRLSATGQPGDLPADADIPAAVRLLYRRCLSADPDLRPTAAEAARTFAAAAGVRAMLPDDNPDTDALGIPVGAVAVRAEGTRPLGRVGAVLAVTAVVVAVVIVALSSIPSGSGVAGSTFAIGPSASAREEAPSGTPTGGPATPSTSTNAGVPPVVPGAPVAVGTQIAPVRVSSPAITPAPTTPPTTVPPLTSTTVSFTSAGGSVVAGCVETLAYLLSWTPAPGYQVNRIVQGPAAEALAAFRSRRDLVTMIVTCDTGVPVLTLA